jgi:hypothetical protein
MAGGAPASLGFSAFATVAAAVAASFSNLFESWVLAAASIGGATLVAGPTLAGAAGSSTPPASGVIAVGSTGEAASATGPTVAGASTKADAVALSGSGSGSGGAGACAGDTTAGASGPTPDKTIGGTSGSPIIDDASGKVVGVNNTGNESGGRCTMNNPCEIDAGGKITVRRGTNYGQQTFGLVACFGPGTELNLSLPGCQVAKP